MVLIPIALKMVYTFVGETATPRISVPNIEPAILSAMIARCCADRDLAKRMFQEALTLARRMTWYNNHDVLREIAVNQAQSSRFRFIDEAKVTFQEAITAARACTSDTKVVHRGLKNKAEALANIAKCQAQSGFIDEARVTFQEARDVAYTITDLNDKEEALKYIQKCFSQLVMFSGTVRRFFSDRINLLIKML